MESARLCLFDIFAFRTCLPAMSFNKQMNKALTRLLLLFASMSTVMRAIYVGTADLGNGGKLDKGKYIGCAILNTS